MAPEAASLRPSEELERAERKRFATALRMLERQTGYNFQARTEQQSRAVAILANGRTVEKAPKLDVHPLFQLR